MTLSGKWRIHMGCGEPLYSRWLVSKRRHGKALTKRVRQSSKRSAIGTDGKGNGQSKK